MVHWNVTRRTKLIHFLCFITLFSCHHHTGLTQTTHGVLFSLAFVVPSTHTTTSPRHTNVPTTRTSGSVNHALVPPSPDINQLLSPRHSTSAFLSRRLRRSSSKQRGHMFSHNLLLHSVSVSEPVSECEMIIDKDAKQRGKPWAKCLIDYSAVNEYVRAHYDARTNEKEEEYSTKVVSPFHTYFVPPDNVPHDKDISSNSKNTPAEEDEFEEYKWWEPLYNAREGIVEARDKPLKVYPPSIHTNGFALLHMPSKVKDWNNMTEIETTYANELTNAIKTQLYPNDKLKNVILWNPMYRGEDLQIQMRDRNKNENPHSPTAGMAHIDTDVGAFTLDQHMDRFSNVRLDLSSDFPSEDVKRVIQKGHRFVILNSWRNIDPNHPITTKQSPLGIMYPRYQSLSSSFSTVKHDEDAHHHFYFFPEGKPNMDQCQWYMYPNMTHDECLWFKQFDRDARYTSDIYHCALRTIEGAPEDDDMVLPAEKEAEQEKLLPPRRSFDIRALVIFDETIENPLYDRYRDDRRRPYLSLEESGCFCDKQADRRYDEEEGGGLACIA